MTTFLSALSKSFGFSLAPISRAVSRIRLARSSSVRTVFLRGMDHAQLFSLVGRSFLYRAQISPSVAAARPCSGEPSPWQVCASRTALAASRHSAKRRSASASCSGESVIEMLIAEDCIAGLAHLTTEVVEVVPGLDLSGAYLWLPTNPTEFRVGLARVSELQNQSANHLQCGET